MEMGDEAGEKGTACSGEALVRSLDISGQVEVQVSISKWFRYKLDGWKPSWPC
jgi:hypothetical protein